MPGRFPRWTSDAVSLGRITSVASVLALVLLVPLTAIVLLRGLSSPSAAALGFLLLIATLAGVGLVIVGVVLFWLIASTVDRWLKGGQPNVNHLQREQALDAAKRGAAYSLVLIVLGAALLVASPAIGGAADLAADAATPAPTSTPPASPASS
jgi:hypothetical protein